MSRREKLEDHNTDTLGKRIPLPSKQLLGFDYPENTTGTNKKQKTVPETKG